MSRPRVLLRWCVPDLAFATACVTLFYCLFLFQGYQKLFRDSDAGWHIRTGEAILATGTLPRTDPYSFTRAGQPWFAWEWLADVAVGRHPSQRWDSRASPFSMPRRSPPESGFGSACTGRWAAIS